MVREKSCGAVVFRKNKQPEYLLLHYEAGHWDFVKGNVEIGENEKDTVVRELREETGITKSRFIGDFREKISYFYRRKGKTVYKEVIFYLIQTNEDNVKISYEHVGYEWLEYNKAMQRLTFNTAKNVLRKTHEFLEKYQND
ncbi:MAG: NUDIX domain-containing protein [Candidatus Bathyarchaeota archaeon]|jgi:8-oxo-dGTP pyrophosphatase MutT (NUDIX family)